MFRKDLKYPTYSIEAGEELSWTDTPLLPEDELIRFLNSEAGGKNLVYLNYFKKINDANISGDPNVIATEYKGQWRGDVIEGLGILKFSDGSTYQG